MKVDTFLDELGDVLHEDFQYAVVWTKDELLGYLRQVLQEFFSRTRIAHKTTMEVVDGTTGEASVPTDFDGAFYVMFDQQHKDLVKLEELDFLEADWATGGTASTPQAATVFGSGGQAKVRFTPVPSTVVGALGSGSITEPTIAGVGSATWDLDSDDGRLTTVSSSETGVSITLAGPTTFWDLDADALGQLQTTASSSSSSDVVYLIDNATDEIWTVGTDDNGILETTSATHGIIGQAKLDDVNQTITQDDSAQNDNYGIVIDAYATGVSTTPTDIIRANRPVGLTIYDRTADDSMDMWYVGQGAEVTTVEDEIFVSSAFLPIIKHGVLGLAYMHDGEGKDAKKARLLDGIFAAECEAVKRLYGAR